MAIRLDKLRKLEAASLPHPPAPDAAQALELIIKVRTPHHVPEGVAVRAWISPPMPTASAPASALTELERDPQVVSVSIRKKLRTIG